MSNYFTKLKDPRWQKKRLEVLEFSDWSCEVCGDTESTLHVHHKQYIKGREPWEYGLQQLAVLCEHCHDIEHSQIDRLIDVISRLPVKNNRCLDREKAACMIAGAMGLDDFELHTPEQLQWFNAGMDANLDVMSTNYVMPKKEGQVWQESGL